MQEPDGTFTQLKKEDVDNLGFVARQKVIKEGQVFKIKRCYFRIRTFTKEGMYAEGISRKQYYDLKRGRPDWC